MDGRWSWTPTRFVVNDDGGDVTAAPSFSRQYTPVNNTPIYGFYIYYRPTDSDNDSDYKKDVVEGDRYWHSITNLQPETAYDIKMQSFNEKGESEFGNVVILETKGGGSVHAHGRRGESEVRGIKLKASLRCVSPAHPNHPRPIPVEIPDQDLGPSNGVVPRPGDLPYFIVVIVLGTFIFIIIAFIPFCLWRTWAKQSERRSGRPQTLAAVTPLTPPSVSI